MSAVLTHRISRPHRKIRRFGDGWQSGFAKSALPVSGRNEAIEIAEMLSVTPPFEDLGATHMSLQTMTNSLASVQKDIFKLLNAIHMMTQIYRLK